MTDINSNKIQLRNINRTITIVDAANNKVTLISTAPNNIDVIQGGMTQVIVQPGGNYLEYNQASPASTWIIHHNFAQYPSAVALIIAGRNADSDITYGDINTVTISFPSPQAGKAILS